MNQRTRALVGVLPLVACLLTLRVPAPAVRTQSTTSSNRSRIQRPVRGHVRIDGDHHHEEVPHIFVPWEAGDGPQDSPAALDAFVIPVAAVLPELQAPGAALPVFAARRPLNRWARLCSGRAPPFSL